ncbi:MAG: hypothetical protein SFV81_19295 [Pirellulaceae bacterium]|nr:hypothetical protein [Pirellulaceae bacterium]
MLLKLGEITVECTSMAAWRRKLIALFPELRLAASAPDFTPYTAFFELLPLCRVAHEHRNENQLKSIYAYSEWCFNQKSQDLWNSSGVCFYEHLFDMPESMWPEIVEWLSPNVVASCRGLWEARLDAEDMLLVERLIEICKNPKYAGLHEHLRTT